MNQHAPALNLRESAYGILLREDKVLMTHTRSASRIIINFPGGGLDKNETIEAALRREFKEEAGAEAVIGRHLHTSSGKDINPDFPRDRLRFHYFLVDVIGEVSLSGNNDDVSKLEWVAIEQLPLEKMLDPDKEFCLMLKELVRTGLK